MATHVPAPRIVNPKGSLYHFKLHLDPISELGAVVIKPRNSLIGMISLATLRIALVQQTRKSDRFKLQEQKVGVFR